MINMKKMLSIFSLILLFLAGCAASEEEAGKQEEQKEKKASVTEPIEKEEPVNEESDQTQTSPKEEPDQEKAEENDQNSKGETEVSSEENTEKPKESPENTDKKIESEQSTAGPFLEYRPETGTKKQFKEDGVVLLTENVVAANEEFVQIALTLGDSTTTQIYKWTGSEITLVYEERDLQDHSVSLLDSFEPNMNEKLLGDGADWKLLEKSAAVETDYGKQKNVFVIQKISNEVVDEETIFTRYYAPKLGLVKEDFELTGENGYKGESSLSSVE
jgi:DNA mismatch repair ATPase MutL